MNRFSITKTVRLYLIVIFLFTFLNCDILDSGKDLRSIEGDIIFSVYEGYEHYDSISEPGIMLSMISEKIYPCYNLSIEHETSVESNEISLVNWKNEKYYSWQF